MVIALPFLLAVLPDLKLAYDFSQLKILQASLEHPSILACGKDLGLTFFERNRALYVTRGKG
jgi:hypothetical protein